MRRHVLRTALALLFSACACAPARAQSATETQVKATFLYRFASFITWPSGAFASPQAPINLCVVGHDPFGASLDNAVRGQEIGGRAIAVRRLSNYEPHVCQILFVGGGDQAVTQVLRAARGEPVLTITDADESAVRGMIHFVIVDNHVRFHIDDARAAESQLGIGSRLLDLGVSVRRRAGT